MTCIFARPGEVFVPAYRVSRTYVNQVNVTNTVVNVTKVTNVYNTYTTTNINNIDCKSDHLRQPGDRCNCSFRKQHFS